MSGCELVTVFPDVLARSMSWRTLADVPGLVCSTVAPTKETLPLLKLARFSHAPNARGCLRYDANVLAITGVEGDYDGEAIGFRDAVETLRRAGITGLVYTSPSHSEERPRWRVLCPTSTDLAPQRRAPLLDHLNDVLGGVLSRESRTQSQSYFFGRVDGSPVPRVAVQPFGRPIDLCNGSATTRLTLEETLPSCEPGGDAPGAIAEYSREALSDLYRRFPQHAERWSPEESYALVAMRNAERQVIGTPPGRRGTAVFDGSLEVGRLAARGWISAQRIVTGMWHAAHSNGLTRDDGEAAVMREIFKGLAAGLNKPFHGELRAVPQTPLNNNTHGNVSP